MFEGFNKPISLHGIHFDVSAVIIGTDSVVAGSRFIDVFLK